MGEVQQPERESGVIDRRPTVFLADDDDLFRAVLKDELIAHGYAVEDVSDGAQALELLAMAADGLAASPDVVVLDVRMPGYSGLGVLNVMRRFAKRPPTLLLTAVPDPSIDVLARTMGAFGVLHKPVELDEVLDAVEEAVLSKARRSSRV
ncbi:MAG: response regulator [Labilithrix sp.]|nr:response regulator [Labilithrix sp.]MBX3220595.1 response regulator [Labilithrix sp.]